MDKERRRILIAIGGLISALSLTPVVQAFSQNRGNIERKEITQDQRQEAQKNLLKTAYQSSFLQGKTLSQLLDKIPTNAEIDRDPMASAKIMARNQKAIIKYIWYLNNRYLKIQTTPTPTPEPTYFVDNAANES